MGGPGTAQHLSSSNRTYEPCSFGYMDDIGHMAGQEEGISAFLQKPFTPEVSLHAVRNLLDSSAVSETAGASIHRQSPKLPR